MKEIWLPVKNYEGLYEVSNLGRVRSLGSQPGKPRKATPGKVLKMYIRPDGYPSVTLSKKAKLWTVTVHILVARTFLPPNPTKIIVNHKDGVKGNNRLDNLEWCTPAENIMHGYALKLGMVK